MDTSVITAIIGALSVLGGTGLGAFIKSQTTKKNHAFQLQFEIEKRQAEAIKQEIEMQKQRLLDVHVAISSIEREFSRTSMAITWRSGMTKLGYDKKYCEICEKLDEVRAICDLYIPDVSKNLENMYGQMNIFWGNFHEFLHLTELQEPNEMKAHFHMAVFSAAKEIGVSARDAKARLSYRICAQVLQPQSFLLSEANDLAGGERARSREAANAVPPVAQYIAESPTTALPHN